MEQPWGRFVLDYMPTNADPSRLPQNVQRAWLRYENGVQIPCLLHYYRPPVSYDRILDCFNRLASQTSSHFLRVLGLVDRRDLVDDPCIIVVTEHCDTTFASWVRENRLLEVDIEGYGLQLTTELAYILRCLFEALRYLMDEEVTHGNINMDNVFIVNGTIKLGMFGYEANDVEQLAAMLSGLQPADLIPYHLKCLLESIRSGGCWSGKISTKIWRENNAKFAAKHPAFKTDTLRLKQRESISYKIKSLLVENKQLCRWIHREMICRMDYLLDHGAYDWVAFLQGFDPNHYFGVMLIMAVYHITNPFDFARFGRNFKVHKPPNISATRDEHELELILNGYLNTIVEVLSGFGVEIDD